MYIVSTTEYNEC